MAVAGRGSATVMTSGTGPEFSEGQNKALDRLKSCMGGESYLLESLKFDRALVSLHQDNARRFPQPPVSPHRIEIGTTDRYRVNTRIYAYLFKNEENPWAMKVLCYALPSGRKAASFHPNDIYRGDATLHESFRHLNTSNDLNTMLKLYFIDQGFGLDWVDFSESFIKRVKALYRLLVKDTATLTGPLEQTRSESSRRALVGTATVERSQEHEESPGPSTTAVKREHHSTPNVPSAGHNSTLTRSDPTSTTRPVPRNQRITPTRPAHNQSTSSKPRIDPTLLAQHFTAPMEAAQSEEKSLDKKLLTTKQKLDRHQEDIEALWAKIADADKKKLKLESKMQDYERRKEQAQKTQKDLVDRLDPGLKSFIKVARELDIEGEERDVKRVKRG